MATLPLTSTDVAEENTTNGRFAVLTNLFVRLKENAAQTFSEASSAVAFLCP